MVCADCGGEVVWIGPITNLSHTECKQCGAINNYLNEHGEDDLQSNEIAMMKIKTSKLKGLALDWAVGKAVGVDVRIGKEFIVDANHCAYCPTTRWAICGEFVDTYAIELINEMLSNDFGHYQIAWSAICNYLQDDYYDGDTPQEAICRATVAVVLGGEVDVPEELVNG